MIRFIKELFNPEAKCRRVRHDKRMYKIIAYVMPTGLDEAFDAVAVEVTAVAVICHRCGMVMEDPEQWLLIDKRPIDSLSMGSSKWRELENTGFLITSKEIDDGI
jgi:hypothetical protein